MSNNILKIRYEEYSSNNNNNKKVQKDTKLNDKLNIYNGKKKTIFIKNQSTSHIDNEIYLNHFEKGFKEIQIQSTAFDPKDTNNIIDTTIDNNNNNNNLHNHNRNNEIQSNKNNSNKNKFNPIVDKEIKNTNIDSNLIEKYSNHWFIGPKNPKGFECNASSQSLTCMSVFNNEITVGSTDHALYVYDLLHLNKKHQILYTKKFGHQEWITCVKHLPNGLIVSGGMDSKICIWKKTKGITCIDLKGHFGSISDVQSNKDGNIIISGSYDKTLRSWNTNTGDEIMIFKGHTAPVLTFQYLNHLLISGSRDGELIFWDIEKGTIKKRINNTKYGHITCLELFYIHDKDLFYIAVGFQKGMICIYDTKTYQKIRPDLHVHNDKNKKGTGAVNSLKFISKLGYLVSGGADNKIFIINIKNNFNIETEWIDHTDFIYSMESYGILLLSGSGNGMLLVHNLENKKLLYGLGANEAAIRSIYASEKYLIAAGDNGKIIVYDMTP